MVNEEQMKDLIENMVNNIQTEAVHLDLILSGGAFNAIYLVGCLYFFREKETPFTIDDKIIGRSL